MLKKNFLKDKLQSGRTVLGTWCTIPSAITADIISSTGLDFIIIDAEHGPISFETAQQMAIAAESRNVSPVMRVGGIHEPDILKALDIGVHCIQIPNVSSKSDIEKIIQLSKYPPIGNRGFSPFTRAGNYSIHNSKTLTEIANHNTLIAINIEGKEAFDKIDDILQLKELDIIFIGLFDLSKSLGMPGEVDHPEVQSMLKNITRKINNSGKYTGTIATSIDKLNSFSDLGIKYIVYLVDCEMLKSSYENVFSKFNL
ncbi:MAG: aldolase/citrate lyase family protein [Chloroherpetonaceae bacterium]|nr:aldolase/citrate lyase family protein [Chloroherpetonaceae bacterium]